jgi:formylmethanofuran dehydrogenase subunit E
MRVLDYGKVAATFVDVETGTSIRIAPRPGIREAAQEYAPDGQNRWAAQLLGYQIMPAGELLLAESVQLTLDLEEIISKPGLRVNCDRCGEEIINAREVRRDGAILCRHCDGDIYFRSIPDPLPIRALANFKLETSN